MRLIAKVRLRCRTFSIAIEWHQNGFKRVRKECLRTATLVQRSLCIDIELDDGNGTMNEQSGVRIMVK